MVEGGSGYIKMNIISPSYAHPIAGSSNVGA